MRSTTRAAFLLITTVAAWSLAARATETILAYKDVQFFKIVELSARRPTTLQISGLAFHSALAVEKITTAIEAKALTVNVYLCLARPGLSGSFDYEFSVPDSVHEVRFGTEKTVIWIRK
jgi:hypothetical protein